MIAVTVCNNLGAQENKICHCFHCFPSIRYEVMGQDARILVFWMLSFKPTFSAKVGHSQINNNNKNNIQKLKTHSSVSLQMNWELNILQGRSNQSILKEINSEYPLEGLTLKLKLQYFGHLMQRANSLEKTLMLGKIESGRKRGWQRLRWLDSITNSVDGLLNEFEQTLGDSEEQGGRPGVLQSMWSQRVGHNLATEQQQRN